MAERYRTSEALWGTDCGRWFLVRPASGSGWELWSNARPPLTDAVFPTGILADENLWPTRAALLTDLAEACTSVGVDPPGRLKSRTGGWWTVDGVVHLRRTGSGWSATIVRTRDPRQHRWDPHRCEHRAVGHSFSTRAEATRAARRMDAEPGAREWWRRRYAPVEEGLV